MKADNVETIKKWTGEDLDMEAEFDALDEGKTGKIFFEDMVKWALKRNMKIELLKRGENENGRNGGNGENEKEV